MNEKKEQIYEGKAKIVFKTDDPKLVIQHFKDSATAFDGKKKGTIEGKGTINAKMSARLFRLLEENDIKTQLVDILSDDELLTWWLDMVPVEVVVRNVAAGSLAKRLGYEEGVNLKKPVIEFYYKNDALGDPLVNEDHVAELDLASPELLVKLREAGLRINKVLSGFFNERGLILVDFKLEFGLKDGELVLADEISPDTCRLWDKQTREKLDKDRFRRDLGNVEEAYQEVFRRIMQ